MVAEAKRKKRNRQRVIVKPRAPEGDYTIYYTPRSRNVKTGDMPQAWMGKDREETAESCRASGCPLLHSSKGGEGNKQADLRDCYAWNGTPHFAFLKMLKKVDELKKAEDTIGLRKYTLEGALENRAFSSRYVRFTQIGDPSVIGEAQMQSIVATIAKHNKDFCGPNNGIKIIGFIHGWRQAPHWKPYLMASVDSLEEADEAIDAGWRPAVHLPEGEYGKSVKTPKGRSILLCPHSLQGEHKRKMTPDCNACGWCSVENTQFQFGIALVSHT